MKKSLKNSMNKRGALETFVIVTFVVIAGAILAGSYVITQSTGSLIQYKYIGDVTTKIFYDFKCINKISEEDRIVFNSFKSANRLGFQYSPTCLK